MGVTALAADSQLDVLDLRLPLLLEDFVSSVFIVNGGLVLRPPLLASTLCERLGVAEALESRWLP